MSPRVTLRTDASLDIGSGHVMRCLTLADVLTAQGAECRFICREHPGHMIEHIHNKGYRVDILPICTEITGQEGKSAYASESFYAQWLGCPWEEDALQTKAVFSEQIPDWLIVDHYALDKRWEMSLQGCYKKLMVIDDLANRPHVCNLLLDQNLGRDTNDYDELVPEHCQRLIGPQYALLRPVFAALRDYSLQRRQSAQLKTLLITMGGVDLDNASSMVLEALRTCTLPSDCKIIVVMGERSPWLEQVRAVAKTMPCATEVRVNIADMAQVMANSDLAIGAAGGTSWERCCLGLPSLLVILANNQIAGANALEKCGAALILGTPEDLSRSLTGATSTLLTSREMWEMVTAASEVTDGHGGVRVAKAMGLFV